MSEAILKAVQEHAESTAARLDEQGEKIKSLHDELADMAQRGSLPPGWGTVARKSLMQTINDSEQLQALRNRTTKAASIPMDGVSLKNIVGDAGGVGDSPFPLQAQRDHRFGEDVRRPLSLLDIAPRIAVNTGSFEFVQLSGYTNAAAVQVMQGDEKARQTTDVDLQTANIATIAVVEAMSEQVMADSPALAQFLQSRMIYNVLEKAERDLLAGPGGTGQIAGLVNQATTFTASTGAASADAIGEAAAELSVAGWDAGLIVMHPRDWQAIRSERTTGGEYVATGWNQPSAANVWGVPVIANAALTEGTVLVLDPRQMLVLDRQQPRFELGYMDDGFARNILTCRAELRLGLAVFSPSAVLKLEL